MSHQLRCAIRDLVQEQASDSAHAYAKAVLDMLQVPDVRSEAYAEASKRASRAQAELTELKCESSAHCREHKCTGRMTGRGWKHKAFADVQFRAFETDEST